MANRAYNPVTAPPPKPQQFSRQGSKLPREIVAWLQSLGTTGTVVNNPKRDLSSGYHIGEICAQYWSDVPRHSLRNELSVQHKQANWRVLAKLFARHDAPLSDAMIDGMIAARDPQYAEVFLLQLYSLLTGRALRSPLPADALALPPPTAPGALYRPRQVLAAMSLEGSSRAAASSAPVPDAADVKGSGNPRGTVSDGWIAMGGGGVAALSEELSDSGASDTDATHPSMAAAAAVSAFGTRSGGALLPPLRNGWGVLPIPLPRSPAMSSASGGRDRQAQPYQHASKGLASAGRDAGMVSLDGVYENGRAPVKFQVSVRAAKQASTIVSGSRPSAKRAVAEAVEKDVSEHQERQPQQLTSVVATPSAAEGHSATAAPTLEATAAATADFTVDMSFNAEVAMWIAAIMAKALGSRAVDANDGGGDDNDDEGDVAAVDKSGKMSRRASAAIVRFYRCTQQHPTRGRAVWALLCDQSEPLAARARADSGGVFEQLVEILLRVPMALARSGVPTTSTRAAEATTMIPTVDGWPVLQAVVSRLAALDPYPAAASVAWGLLGNCDLMRLCVTYAQVQGLGDGLAGVLLATVQPLVLPAAVAHLQRALQTLEDSLFRTGSHAPEPAGLLHLLIHHSLLQRVAKGAIGHHSNRVGSGTGGASASLMDSNGDSGVAVTTPATTAGSGVGSRPSSHQATAGRNASVLEDWLHHTCTAHALHAIQRLQAAAHGGESPMGKESGASVSSLQLAAVLLAVSLQQIANTSRAAGRAMTTAETFAPFLCGPVTLAVAEPNRLAFALAQVKWMRAAATASLRSGDNKGNDVLAVDVLAALMAVCDALDDLAAATTTVVNDDTKADATASTQTHLEEEAVTTESEGPIAVATAVAGELASLLGDLADTAALENGSPLSLEAAARVADTVVGYFTSRCPTELSTLIFTSTATDVSVAIPLWDAPVLGPVGVAAGIAEESSSLLLTEALLRRYPTAASGSGGEPARKDFPPPTAAAAAALRRRVVAAGVALARDGGSLDTLTEARLRWLYYFNRGGRGHSSSGSSGSTNRVGMAAASAERESRFIMRTMPSPAAAAAAASESGRWRTLQLSLYEDLILVTAAAEALMARQQQRAAAAARRADTDATNSSNSNAMNSPLLALAAMAQRVILVWAAHAAAEGMTGTASERSAVTERAGSRVSASSAAAIGGAAAGAAVVIPQEGTETAEELTAAMEWYHSTLLPAV